MQSVNISLRDDQLQRLDEQAAEGQRSQVVRDLLDMAFDEKDREDQIGELEQKLERSRRMYLREIEINNELRESLDE